MLQNKQILLKYKGWLVFIIIILALSFIIYFTRPTPVILGSYSASLEGLTVSQRKNICLAAKKINGRFIQSGDTFSFNGVVGPRSLEAGFVPSKAIFEQEIVDSVGGGICLLSSTLYNAAIRSNLNVIDRVAHTRTIRSVPSGLDATVWYGINDLKFQNNTDAKIKIDAICSYRRLNIAIKGYKEQEKATIKIDREKIAPNRLQVTVYRRTLKTMEKLSEDIYTVR